MTWRLGEMWGKSTMENDVEEGERMYIRGNDGESGGSLEEIDLGRKTWEGVWRK